MRSDTNKTTIDEDKKSNNSSEVITVSLMLYNPYLMNYYKKVFCSHQITDGM